MSLFAKIDITTEAVPMEIMDLSGNPLTQDETQKPIINLYGTDSEQFRQAIKDHDENDEDKGERLIAACVESWSNIKNDEGIPIEFSPSAALGLFKRYPIIYSQADQFISKRANYLKKS